MSREITHYSEDNGPYDVNWRTCEGREGDFHGAIEVTVYDNVVQISMRPVGRVFEWGKNVETFLLPLAAHSQIAIEKTTPNRYAPAPMLCSYTLPGTATRCGWPEADHNNLVGGHEFQMAKAED